MRAIALRVRCRCRAHARAAARCTGLVLYLYTACCRRVHSGPGLFWTLYHLYLSALCARRACCARNKRGCARALAVTNACGCGTGRTLVCILWFCRIAYAARGWFADIAFYRNARAAGAYRCAQRAPCTQLAATSRGSGGTSRARGNNNARCHGFAGSLPLRCTAVYAYMYTASLPFLLLLTGFLYAFIPYLTFW